MPDELVILSYQCPLCGKTISTNENGGFLSHRLEMRAWYCVDKTPCCGVCLAWLPIDGVIVYVGTFRTLDDFNEWASSCGRARHKTPVGSMWDVEKQERTIDNEIPF